MLFEIMNEQKESNGGSSSALTTTVHRTPTTSLSALNLFDESQCNRIISLFFAVLP